MINTKPLNRPLHDHSFPVFHPEPLHQIVIALSAEPSPV